MFKGVVEKIAEFDLVFSSYSLHHFQLADKAALFHSAYSALRTGGVFMLLDTVRADNETLHDYYDHYLDYIGENWLALSEQEIQRVSDHVRCSDFPENAQTLHQIALAAGFSRLEILTEHNWHQLIVFYKN
jgi:ubiquinone/menaquinone biosynthesis C-methylase UbiE